VPRFVLVLIVVLVLEGRWEYERPRVAEHEQLRDWIGPMGPIGPIGPTYKSDVSHRSYPIAGPRAAFEDENDDDFGIVTNAG
jgi:hypothetical protein